jgi:hypothetical protein
MSKKEPKSAKNTSAQEAVENLFHPKASGTPKSTPKARRNRGRKALNPHPQAQV